MKLQRFSMVPTLLVGCCLPLCLHAQIDSTGLPGDQFSLEGALELFKTAASPEAFEEALNKEEYFVNNLDLNEDGEVDYVKVIDFQEGDAHALVLQVPINESEDQDIAVIEIEEKGPENALLQIIGDEALYGAEMIVEPFAETLEDKGKGGPTADFTLRRLTVNVYFWPSVRFIYQPNYRPWVSPFRWRNYPRWWKPWRPHPWQTVHTRRAHYTPHYHRVSTHRVTVAHRVYQPRRRTSTVVHTKTTVVPGKGVKKTTTSRKVVTGKNGKVKAGKKTTTTTVTRKKNRPDDKRKKKN